MNSSIPEKNTGAAQPSRSKKRIRYVLWGLAILLVLLLTGLTVLAAAIFSDRKQIPLEPLTTNDLVFQQNLLRRISGEIFRRRNVQQDYILLLSLSELESLIRVIDNGFEIAKAMGQYSGPSPRYFEPVFGKGHIQAVYPFDTGHSWLFGGVIHCRITATPRLENNILTIDLHDCTIGDISLPRSIAEKIKSRLLDHIHRSSGYRTFCGIVKKFHIKSNGSLEITCSPDRLLKLLTFSNHFNRRRQP